MSISMRIFLRLQAMGALVLVLVAACASIPEPSNSVRPQAATPSTITSGGNDAGPRGTETVVIKDQPYYELEGRVWHLDVYHPSSGDGYPLVILFHGNPVFGATKESVRSLATMMAESGAVVVAPTWGGQMSMGDMHAIAHQFEIWASEQGPCAVWAGVDLAKAVGADDQQLSVVGLTTGVLPAQAAIFAPHPEAEGCLSGFVLAPIEKAILFDTDWMLVPSIWDEVLTDDPSFLKNTSSFWDQVDQPTGTRIIMLAGEITAPETDRSLEGKTYLESDWVRVRDPNGELAESFDSSGTLEDGSMSFTDVTRVVVELLIEGGWDAELMIVPGVAHAVTGQAAQALVASLAVTD